MRPNVLQSGHHSRPNDSRQHALRAGTGCLFLLCALLAWAGGAAANVRVNQDPPGNPQNTPSIALDQSTGNRVVGYNDIPGNRTGVGASYWSPGTGIWTDSSFPSFAWYGFEQDPSVAADQSRFVFLSQVSYNQPLPNNSLSGIYVSRSSNGGANFGAPVQVAYYGQRLPGAVKPKIEVDDFVGTGDPFDGNVYVIWQEDQPNQLNADARFARSTDRGVSWQTLPAPLNDNRGQDFVTWPDLAVGGDGSIEAAWLEKPTTPTQYQGQIWVDRSLDGGQSFRTDVPAATFWSVPQWLTDGSNTPKVPATSYPSVEIAPSNPNRIGIVYAADPDDGAACETRIDFGDIPPGTSEAYMLSPFHGGSNISCNRSSPNYVYAVWRDQRNGIGDVFFSRARITGAYGIANWTGDTRLSTQPAYQRRVAQNASIVSSGSNVYVAWDEWNGADFVHLIYFNRSTDYGQTWLSQAINIDSQMQVAYAGRPSICCDGRNVCVAWEVGRGTNQTDIYCNYSTDAGFTWQPAEIPIRTGHWSLTPQITHNGYYVCCVWTEGFGAGPNSDIYASCSVNNGQTWSAPARLDFNKMVGSSLSWGPKICSSPYGNEMYVVWEDCRVNGIDNPYFAHSYDGGYTWQGDIRLNTGMAAGMSRDYMTQIACDGVYPSYVAVVYTSDRARLGQASDVYMNCSIDGGVTWFASDVRLNQGLPPGTARAAYPRLCVYDYGYPNQAYFYAVWQDDRNSANPMTGWDIYGTYADYNPMTGQWTWLNNDYRIDVGDQPGANVSEFPHVDCDWTGPYYVWRDVRNGLGDIYANQYRTGPDEGDIFYVESNDAGQTWSSPIRVNDDIGTNDQALPWLDIKPNGIVDVVWTDWRADPFDRNAEFYMATLLPGAMTFSTNVRVTNQTITIPVGAWTLGDYNWVAVDTTQAHCVWTDTRRAGDGQLGDAFYQVVQNPSFGACCLSGNACVMASATVCAAQGGQFMGEGTDCDPNPCGEPIEWYNHDVGQPTMTMTCQGILGFMDGTQTEGNGFVYPAGGQNHLYIGGLWVGLGADYIASRDYDADPEREWVVSEPDGYIHVDESGWISGTGTSDQDVYAGFTDGGAGAPRGLKVEQVSWEYQAPEPADDFVIINYTIENQSPAPMGDVYAGLFMDFDILPDVLHDEGTADPAARMVYLYDPSGIHTGVMILEAGRDAVPVANLTLVENETFVWPNQYVLDVDKDAFLRAADPAHIMHQSPEPNDYSIVASAGPFVLQPGEEKRVSFAVVAGTNHEHFMENARVAEETFERGISSTPGSGGGAIETIRLLPNRPNPFSDATSLAFELPEEQEVRMSLYDVGGRRVRELLHDRRSAGRHEIGWEGRDDAGRTVAEGIYFVKLQIGKTVVSRPILLLR